MAVQALQLKACLSDEGNNFAESLFWDDNFVPYIRHIALLPKKLS